MAVSVVTVSAVFNLAAMTQGPRARSQSRQSSETESDLHCGKLEFPMQGLNY